MRVIKERTLQEYLKKDKYKDARGALQVWVHLVRKHNWTNPLELKATFRSASIVGGKRVVFNIKGNEFRLVVDIEYILGVVFVIWFGTHKEYDRIHIKDLGYGDKTN